jgi:hypothetical protein
MGDVSAVFVNEESIRLELEARRQIRLMVAPLNALLTAAEEFDKL